METQNKIANDIASLTNISSETITRLIKIATICVSECLRESILNNDTTCDVDIGIGTLILKLEEGDLKMRFLPSDLLTKLINSQLKNTKLNKKYSLDNLLSSSLKSKVEDLYKEFI